MKQIRYYLTGVVAAVCGLLLYSCDDSYPKALESPYDTDLLEAYIMEGSKKHVGVIDEAGKTAKFDVFPRTTDFESLRLVVKVSEGASDNAEELRFAMASDEYEKIEVLSVKSGNRYKNYFIQVDKKRPPTGVDFSRAIVYDHSVKTNNIYSSLSTHLTRCADMDGEHVLMVYREGIKMHLLAIEDLRQGKINPIEIKNQPFASWAGGLAHGHIYGVNLPNPSGGGSIQLLHWENAEAKPDLKVITADELKAIGYNAEGRFGDYMSVNINERGSGSIFLGVNPSQADYKILQLKIKNFSEITDMKFLNPATYGGFWATFNQVDGSPSEYLYTGHQGPVMLASNNGEIIYSMKTENIPIADAADAHILNFNKAKYMITTTAFGEHNFKIYDITRGETTKEALEILETTDPFAYKYNYAMGGNTASGYAAGMTAWSVSEDGETLYIMTGAPYVGFALLEFPKMYDDEEEEE